jgi:polyisoprenoid-binding protein YceI
MKRLALAVVVALGVSAAAQAQNYVIDPAHSSVLFTVHHLVGKVPGRFDKFEGTFSYDPADPKSWQTEATIQSASVDTGNDKRDAHLRTPDFFDAATFPTLTFKSTGVSDVKDNHAKLAGNLTMHGVTKPVVLDLEIGGVMKDPKGTEHAGASATTSVSRKDFGIGAKMPNAMLGDDIRIEINIEGIVK